MFPIQILSLIHISLIVISNILVQYPFQILGFHTTWGAFAYPLIFITTDLTTRLLGKMIARKIVFRSMLPGLVISYGLACFFNVDNYMLGVFPELPLRIALACFCAYVSGQLLDICVFQYFRQNKSWWLAPALSASAGNLLDTFIFFFLAFYHCNNSYLNQHWIEIACVDFSVKMTFSLLAFIPLYGIILNLFTKQYKSL